eukprot:09298_2
MKYFHRSMLQNLQHRCLAKHSTSAVEMGSPAVQMGLVAQKLRKRRTGQFLRGQQRTSIRKSGIPLAEQLWQSRTCMQQVWNPGPCSQQRFESLRLAKGKLD